MISKQITESLEKLSHDRKIFHSEADFQFALAFEIQSKNPELQVRLERPFKFEDKKEKVYVDLVIIAGDSSYGIELKYKTKKIKDTIHGEEFDTANHAATNHGRFDFWANVDRLLKIIRSGKLDGGMVILLTNEPNYWNNDSKNYCSHQFHLKDGRQIKKAEVLKWKNKKCRENAGKKRNSCIKIERNYQLCWVDYSEIKVNNKTHEFRYLSLEV